jgi:hypothetical protein
MQTVWKRVTVEYTKTGRGKLVSAHKVSMRCAYCSRWTYRLRYAFRKRTYTVHEGKGCPGIFHYHSLEHASVSRVADETLLTGLTDCDREGVGGCAGGTWFEPRGVVSLSDVNAAEDRYFNEPNRALQLAR